MEDTKLAEATSTTPASAAPAPGSDISSQIDVESMTLEQAETLLSQGKAELPLKSSGEGTVQEPPVAKVDDPPPGDTPAAKVDEPAAKVEDVVEKTRTPEEITAAQDAARAAVVEAGGTEEEQEAAAAEAAKAQQPAAKVEPEPEPAPAAVDDPAKRFRVKDPMARAALSIYKAMEEAGTPITLAEAEKRVRGGDEPAPKVEAEPVVDHVAIVGTLETEVAALEAKIDEAGEGEGLITKEFTELTKQLTKKTTALAMARLDMKQATERAAAEDEVARRESETARKSSKEIAARKYPDAVVEGSQLDLAIKAEIKALSDKKHPDHAILYADSAPLIIASRVAERLGIAPVVAKAVSPPVKAKVEAPAITKLSPVPGGKTSVVPGAPTEAGKATKAEAYLLSSEASLQDLDAAAGAGAPSPKLRELVGA